MIMNNNYDFILTSNDYEIITSQNNEILEYPKRYNIACIKNWCFKFNYQFNKVIDYLQNYYNKYYSINLHFTEQGRIMKR